MSMNERSRSQVSHAERSARVAHTVRSTLCAGTVAALLAVAAHAGPNEQAKRMYDRIAGVPAATTVNGVPSTSSELSQMAALISAGNPLGAAAIATNSPSFYDTVLKNWAMPWTNKTQTVFAPLNDYVATVIGMVRDDVPFNTALSADILYTSNAPGLPAPSPANNNHYATAEAQNVNLQATLVQTTQSGTYGTPAAATAGLMTTAASAGAFFYKGTNRAMVRFTLIAHLCNDLQYIEDITRPPDRIRQDVSRSPGGDSRVFLNTCIGCHSGMDPMAQAFAYYDFDLTTNQMTYTAGTTAPKYHINTANFPYGYVTTSDAWSNYWRQGPNQILGWASSVPGTSTPGSGNGAKSLGQELESSDAFAACQVQKVFTAVCYRSPTTAADFTQVAQMKSDFTSGGYKLKQMFAEAAVYCMGN